MAAALIRRFGSIGILGALLALPAGSAIVSGPAPSRTTPLVRMAGYTGIPQGMVPIINALVQKLNTDASLRNQLDPAMARLLLQQGFNANDPVTQKLLAPALSGADPAAVNVDNPKKLLNFFNGMGSSARSEYAAAVLELQEEIAKLPAASQMDETQRKRLFELLYFIRRLEILSAYAEPDLAKKGTAQRKVAEMLATANKALREKVNPFMEETIGGMLAQADQFILNVTPDQFVGVLANAYGFQHVNQLKAYDPNAAGADASAANAALQGINNLQIATNDNLAQGFLVASLGAELKKGDSAHATKVKLVLDKIALGSAFGSVKALFIQTLLGTGASADVLQKIEQMTTGSQDKGFLQNVVNLLVNDGAMAVQAALAAALTAATSVTDPAAQASAIQAANADAAKDKAAINALVLKLLSAAPTTIATPAASPQNASTAQATPGGPGWGAKTIPWAKRLGKFTLTLASILLALHFLLGFFAPNFRNNVERGVLPAWLAPGIEQPLIDPEKTQDKKEESVETAPPLQQDQLESSQDMRQRTRKR